MTVDVNVAQVDEAFLDDIDEIKEDTLIQIFIVHPKNLEELETVQESADDNSEIFYSIPLTLQSQADANCKAYFVDDEAALLALSNADKPLFIQAIMINDTVIEKLLALDAKGIIINPTTTYEALPNFYLSIGANNVSGFDHEVLAKLDMDDLVLESSYPAHPFEIIEETAKVISNAMFRPEQSIIAHATTSSLKLFGFKK